ncbi:hypothetical protein CCUS01_02770 [Colletotrichum cuscutae]|uniref:Uncharacterized protein n=1 Tax=Colletotrichum cuscutae TaxID=1209917 RepID=A0AAI9YC08_9PEZI|nr:hypothetical protein CCUS01_02770 [Colletotrichum cuscutae]
MGWPFPSPDSPKIPQSRYTSQTGNTGHTRLHLRSSGPVWPPQDQNQKMTSNGAFVLGAGPFGHPISSQTHSEYVSIRTQVPILFLAKVPVRISVR